MTRGAHWNSPPVKDLGARLRPSFWELCVRLPVVMRLISDGFQQGFALWSTAARRLSNHHAAIGFDYDRSELGGEPREIQHPDRQPRSLVQSR